MGMRVIQIPVTTAGGDGVAAGSAGSAVVIRGELIGVAVDYHASAPNTTDVTVATNGNGPGGMTLCTVTSANTDIYVAPRAKPVDSDGVAITNAHTPFAISDYVTVTVAQCNALTNAVIVYLYVREW